MSYFFTKRMAHCISPKVLLHRKNLFQKLNLGVNLTYPKYCLKTVGDRRHPEKDCAEYKKNFRYFWIAPRLTSCTHSQIRVLILLHLLVFSLLVKVIFYDKPQFNQIGPLWLSGKPGRIEVGKEIQQEKWL